MALARPLPPLWQSLLPTLNGPIRPVMNLPLLQRIAQPFRLLPTPFAALAFPFISLPSLPSLSDIWEGILRAVPKKKTSHRKKRQRFMAGKGIKDLTNLNKCSACGRVKRAHLLCPYCVHHIRTKIFGSITWEQRNPDGLNDKMRKRLRLERKEMERDYWRRRELKPNDKQEKDKLGKSRRW
ncbi:uncharacterized protein EI97DRAFT_436657 [Westerdykella ornata]|uniref:Large ribosomal subunit protein bL32m n=1 Tax=Westerdykella ornata TaxID=318751 RepID=A0A6A6J8N2_WESOR|nr:uncharacterized protein EI97DRAFT_436657 [Westerdykella ornata]KAF2272725.1 hypothetical protein EI97DRAFT_436657 [Westerdykella ornata]